LRSGRDAPRTVSDLPFTATNGWGPVERNTSNGEAVPGDGRPITLNGTTYPKGLGVHSPGAVTLNLAGNCTRLSATVGVDDQVAAADSVRFAVVPTAQRSRKRPR
jgi:hypothetical protein